MINVVELLEYLPTKVNIFTILFMHFERLDMFYNFDYVCNLQV